MPILVVMRVMGVGGQLSKCRVVRDVDFSQWKMGEIITGGVAMCPTDGGKDVGGKGCEEVMV